MAALVSRPRKDGTVAHTVPWRLGGSRDGPWQTETFDRLREAREFKRDVEAAGHL